MECGGKWGQFIVFGVFGGKMSDVVSKKNLVFHVYFTRFSTSLDFYLGIWMIKMISRVPSQKLPRN